MSGSNSALPVPPAVVHPTISMLVNGAPTPGLIGLSINQNNFLSADTFSADIALGAAGPGAGPLYWATQDSVELTLLISENGEQPSNVIQGLVDQVWVKRDHGLLRVSGRDYTSVFIEAKTAEKFQNQTSAQVIKTLASKLGMEAVTAQTSTPVRKFYETDHASTTNQVSYWTLMTYLAQQEGFDIFVRGKTVYYQPAADPAKGTYPISCNYSAPIPLGNVKNLELQRNLTLAKDVKVTVISWNHEQKKAISASQQKTKSVTTGRAAAPHAPTASTPTTYVFREAGLTQAQCDALAQAKLIELTKHERKIDFDIVGDLGLTAQTLLKLTGTGTDFDQNYFVSDIGIHASIDAGFNMRVNAKNSSPQTTVTL